MKTLRHLLPLALLAAAAQLAPADVPSTINYQGRLTNASGVPQSGSKAMSLKIYDAATSGILLYAETLGNIAVDTNGVYGFQFGAAGSSNTLVTEPLATTDGTSLTYQKVLTNTPVAAGTASVTDGTYNWNELSGNPGTPAVATATIISGFVVGATVTTGGSGYTSAPTVHITGNGSGAAATATVANGAVTGISMTSAGSGYTTGATVTIAPPPAPFLVNDSAGTLTATYASPPAAGITITATYRYSAGGISGALSAGAEQWLELTVDGIAQTPRQKVLAVPFAMTSQVAVTAQTAGSATKLVQKTGLTTSIISFSKLYSGGNSSEVDLARTVYQLPLQHTVSSTYNSGASYKLQRVLDTQNISAINSLTVDVESNSISGVVAGNSYSSQGQVTLSLVSYSSSGARVVLDAQTITASNGTILLSGPFQISDQDKDYAVELEMATFNTISYSALLPGAHFRAGAIQMNYDSK